MKKREATGNRQRVRRRQALVAISNTAPADLSYVDRATDDLTRFNGRLRRPVTTGLLARRERNLAFGIEQRGDGGRRYSGPAEKDVGQIGPDDPKAGAHEGLREKAHQRRSRQQGQEADWVVREVKCISPLYGYMALRLAARFDRPPFIDPLMANLCRVSMSVLGAGSGRQHCRK